MVVRFALRSAVVAVAVLLLPGGVSARQVTLPPELVPVRAGLDKYRDPILAVHDGYLSTLGCVEYAGEHVEGAMQYPAGGMGVHFLNLQAIGPTLDPARPQVLIYEPVGDRLELVAAEWFMPTEVAGDQVPSIFGRQLEGPMAGHQPVMPDGLHHYDLHVWLWKANPAGVFSPTNPSLHCPEGAYSFEEAAPRIVGH